MRRGQQNLLPNATYDVVIFRTINAGFKLLRQPASKEEAVATANSLIATATPNTGEEEAASREADLRPECGLVRQR